APAGRRPGGARAARWGGGANMPARPSPGTWVRAGIPSPAPSRDGPPPWNYAAAEQTRGRLLDAGFAAASCWLAPAPKQPQQPREFLATIVLGPHVQQLPEELREPFMDEVLSELGEPVVVDYVRLNIDATA